MRVISSKSAWNKTQLVDFLQRSVIPIRLAMKDGDYPLICSLWYLYEQESGDLLCASHESSRINRLLASHSRVGFEIAPNEPPYCGIRGKGTVGLSKKDAAITLQTLIQRYLKDDRSSLAKWLMSRVDGEEVIRITPDWITSWDYRERMN